MLKTLERIGLFSQLKKRELKVIFNTSEEKSFKPGEAIIKEGDQGVGLYIIIDGKAVVKRGRRQLSRLHKGSFFGEMSLLDDAPRSADVIAIERTKCLILQKRKFRSLLSRNPGLARGVLHEMARRLRETSARITE
jgi:CRP/FNR family cyclic AMP-dependent transcriptional regulator